jgi:hypothetical protein
MSIATEITRLQNAKSAIKTSIEGKGVTVPSSTTLDGYSTLIDSISSGSSAWTKLGEKDITTASTSTSNSNVGTISCGSGAATKDKIIYVRVRDTAGPRAGYFLGSDTFFINTNKANGSTSAMSTAARLIHRYSTSNQYAAYSGTYGVYAYSITNAGVVNIYRRYNSSNSLTIDGTYHVEVYSLDYPDGKSVFDI